MSSTRLQDAHFRTIGYIDTGSDGKQTIRDAHFRTLGYYNPRDNRTQDAHFRTIGTGNLLTSLLDRE
jgi:hypothetical protein